jgi:hypothetical protein
MAPMLEGCIMEGQRSVVHFLWAKELSAEDIHKEMFPVYYGKCLLCEVVRNCVEKFSQGHTKVADEAQPGCPVEWLRQQPKLFFAAGFSSLVKCWNKYINVGGGHIEK